MSTPEVSSAFCTVKKNNKDEEEKITKNSKHLLSLYEKLRDTALRQSRSGGESSLYGMSVLTGRGMLFWLRLCCDIEPINFKTQPESKSEICPSSKNYHGSFSAELKDILVEMALKKIKKEYKLCHITSM